MFVCLFCRTLPFTEHAKAETHRAYLFTRHHSSSPQNVTDLAYFLEVELWQSMEPVGQLSEVEKLHLKPVEKERCTEGAATVINYLFLFVSVTRQL